MTSGPAVGGGVDRLDPLPSTIRVSGRRRQLSLLLIAFVAAAGLHLVWDARVGRMPSWDQAHHLALGINYAHAVAEGRFREQFQAVYEPYPPGYHLLLAGGTALLGPSRALGLYVNLAALAIIMAATYSIGARLANGRVGLMGAVLVAMYPGVAVYGREALIEFWLAAVTVLSVALLLSSRRFQNGWVSLLLGLTMGFGMLLKPSFAFAVWLPVGIVAGRAMFARDWRAVRNIAIAGIITAGIAATWYYPQREAIIALARVNRADAIRWGHPVSPWLGFLIYVKSLGKDLASWFGEYVAVAAFVITAWRWRVVGILHAWIVGAWTVVVFGLVFRDAKYLLPTLPPMALLVAYLLDWLKPAWLRAATIVVVFVGQAIALLYGEFGSANMPLSYVFGTSDNWVGAKGGESWAVPEIAAAVAQNASRKDARVGVVLDLPRLNGNVLNWQALRIGSHVHYASIAEGARHGNRVAELLQFDMILLKTGSAGAGHLTDLTDAVAKQVRGEPESFRVAGVVPARRWFSGRLVRRPRSVRSSGEGAGNRCGRPSDRSCLPGRRLRRSIQDARDHHRERAGRHHPPHRVAGGPNHAARPGRRGPLLGRRPGEDPGAGRLLPGSEGRHGRSGLPVDRLDFGAGSEARGREQDRPVSLHSRRAGDLHRSRAPRLGQHPPSLSPSPIVVSGRGRSPRLREVPARRFESVTTDRPEACARRCIPLGFRVFLPSNFRFSNH